MTTIETGEYTGCTPNQLLDALHALGASIVPEPDHQPSDADLPFLLGLLTHEAEKALIHHVTDTDHVDRFVTAYREAAGEQVIEAQAIALMRSKTILDRTTTTAPLQRLTVDALDAAAHAATLMARARLATAEDEAVDEAETRDTLRATKTALRHARGAYEDTVKMLRRMGLRI
ncbi:hypothetical protein [Streptomyces sp. SID3343]|uniref:hypothetical protein n=1 Tax=Streptomyces sp. SID3343 TaxID=2690260 RepID=UPI00136FE41C|nr:hypothetical protein [Streptomyces sp. SID3343]MYW06054.1 hypothetical protein [Streptomyces sp. SID3343]